MTPATLRTSGLISWYKCEPRPWAADVLGDVWVPALCSVLRGRSTRGPASGSRVAQTGIQILAPPRMRWLWRGHFLWFCLLLYEMRLTVILSIKWLHACRWCGTCPASGQNSRDLNRYWPGLPGTCSPSDRCSQLSSVTRVITYTTPVSPSMVYAPAGKNLSRPWPGTEWVCAECVDRRMKGRMKECLHFCRAAGCESRKRGKTKAGTRSCATSGHIPALWSLPQNFQRFSIMKVRNNS